MTLRFEITLLHVCNVLDLQNTKFNSMKIIWESIKMNTRVGEQGRFHYNPIDRKRIDNLFLQMNKNKRILHLLYVLQGKQGFCTLANLFRQAKIVVDSLTAPLFFPDGF